MKLHELQEQRSQAVTAMRALADTVEKRGDDYTADEDKKHTDLKKQITDLDAKITRAKDVAELERSAPAVIQGNGKDGAYEDRARAFSITRAIAAACGDSVDAGREREISQEVAVRSGRKFAGIAVPDEVFQVERRTVTTTSGASLYPTAHRGDLFIDRLRDSLIVGNLGATILDGLVGDQEIPRQTASSTAQWVAEDAALTETDAGFDDVTLSPKTVGAMTSYSRRTLINAVPAIEQLVRSDLARQIANAIDNKAMQGTGTSNTPKGITKQTGITSVSLSTVTWAAVLEFAASIATANAAGGSMGWAMNAAAVKTFRTTLKETGLPGYIMEGTAELAGYAVATSQALPGAFDGTSPVAGTVIFGDWSSLLIGQWSGTDILVNPYGDAAYAKGRVQVRAMKDVDVAVRHIESFAISENLKIAE
jgi:HK97 family phage major capsid protein